MSMTATNAYQSPPALGEMPLLKQCQPITGASPSVLTDIYEEHTNIVVWKRDLPESIFMFDGADCKSIDIHVDFSTLVSNDDEHHTEHDNHNDNHAPEHSEIKTKYRYSCEQGHKLKSIRVALFKHFNGLKKINVMWVNDLSQGAEILTANKTEISLK